ncbi:hypothetical protein Dimus_019763 [Dionaea muscipula]
MAASCSHWWHTPIYFTMCVVLAIVAITTSSGPPNPTTTTTTISPDNQTELSLKASTALRQQGFNAIATLFQVSPELFLLSPSSQSTIFAIQDSAFSAFSIPPWAVKHLLQYHTIVPKLSMQDLLGKSSNTCLATSIQGNYVGITKINPKEHSVEINNVPVSHPDLFLDGPIAIHGVLGPFTSSDDLEEVQLRGLDFIWSPSCVLWEEEGTGPPPPPGPDARTEWVRVIRWLSSNGFVSFSIGLHSVLDGILGDYPVGLRSATIFAPPVLGSVGSPSPVLDRIVRYHIVPRMYSYGELVALGNKAALRTLVPQRDLEITGGVDDQALAVNGVGILSPDVFSITGRFIVHGISEAFELPELAISS